MGCNCDDTGSFQAAGTVRLVDSIALKQGFRRFWPEQIAFPPLAPWIGATVNRAAAYSMVQRHASKFQGVEQGSFAAYAELVAAVLYSNDGEFAAERSASKGGGGSNPCTVSTPTCFFDPQCPSDAP